MAKETDEKTLKMIEQVAKQKKEIEKAERPNWITTCSFSYTENPAQATNLHIEQNVRNLILIAAFLGEKELSYNAASQALGIDDPPKFTWQGYSSFEWYEDIKTRVNKIQIGAKKKKLEALETRLNAIISPDLRAQLELEAIERDLAK